MAEYAPDAIKQLFDLIHESVHEAVLSGILGDSAHTYGYHRARAVLPSSDYSVQYPPDRLGDAWAASALDISLPPDLMIVVSKRLMKACQENDPRVACLREWFGTVNGTRVTGWDRHDPTKTQDDTYTTSDSSHLWHIHLSFYREYANNFKALAPIAAVFAGKDDDVTDADVQKIVNAVKQAVIDKNGETVASALRRLDNVAEALASLQKQVAALQAAQSNPVGGTLHVSGDLTVS